MSFCTVINCLDGRVQLPVISYLKKRFGVNYVDSVTEAGPNHILADGTCRERIEAILERLDISITNHNSVGIAVVGHYDCAGNPASGEEQRVHTLEAVRFLKSRYKDFEVIGLWVDETWQVNELSLAVD